MVFTLLRRPTSKLLGVGSRRGLPVAIGNPKHSPKNGVYVANTKATQDFVSTPWSPTDGDVMAVLPGETGFLPATTPPKKLPARFSKLNSILDQMTINQRDGSRGLLGESRLGNLVDTELPMFNVSNEANNRTVAALYRDYSMLASAYSLEPTITQFLATGKYAPARDTLPPQISEPLRTLAAKLGAFPWLDYNYGFVLFNATCARDKDGRTWSDWRACRKFTGLDSEEGFITVHHATVARSGQLLLHQQKALEALERRDHDDLAIALNRHAEVLSDAVSALNLMWRACKRDDFLVFRTFLFGQTDNLNVYPEGKMFYKLSNGQTEEGSWRGETGAMDSLVPSVDNFLQLEYPRNKLTDFLFDLREYRPQEHQRYLKWVSEQSTGLGLRDFVKKDAACCVALLRNLDALRLLRRNHWEMVKAYVLKNLGQYSHPVGTGGAPITTYLPNLLGATMEYSVEVVDAVESLKSLNAGPVGVDLEEFGEMSTALNAHVEKVLKEVHEFQPAFKNETDQLVEEFAIRRNRA